MPPIGLLVHEGFDYQDLLPPGSGQFDWTDGFTCPGYGASPRRWETGTTPNCWKFPAGGDSFPDAAQSPGQGCDAVARFIEDNAASQPGVTSAGPDCQKDRILFGYPIGSR